jgi:acyl-CoA thioester hydrolase
MIKINFKHKTPIQIRFNDIDIAGHVNNAVHLYYYDYGRMMYFNQIFKDNIKWTEIGFVLANININYENPIFLDEKIFVNTKITNIGNKSLTMIQQIINDKNQIKSNNTSIMVGYNYQTKESLKINNDLRKMINDFENN